MMDVGWSINITLNIYQKVHVKIYLKHINLQFMKKKYGDRTGIEDVITNKRKFQYEEVNLKISFFLSIEIF
jgi:hypothetical protein